MEETVFCASIFSPKARCTANLLRRPFANPISKLSIQINKELIVNHKPFSYLKNFNYDEFIQGDIEVITFPKADIIISSSAFQWVNSFEKLIDNISASTNNLAFSIYTKGNLKEIYEHFNISLNYLENKKIHQILRKKFKNITSKKETIILDFNDPLEALRHLKNTGVTGFQKTSISKIRSFTSCTLTYEISYFICKA